MKFNVPDMSCGHCTSAIEKAVRKADAAATVTCDLSSKIVGIETALPEAAISAAIREAGFESRPVS